MCKGLQTVCTGKKEKPHAARIPAQSPVCKVLLCRLVEGDFKIGFVVHSWLHAYNVSSSMALIRVHMYIAAGVCCSSRLAEKGMNTLTRAFELLTFYCKQPAVLQITNSP